eukprot:CAMPEP_0177594992 /NCGR_PEP_ID=MMETSP0419_2-20121207/10098_1 /TAXON_ID=582737 /ORGANISM="Tetraselmis sp., Strain GSL018" /LENGTH=97 /DNA_ID=CAMNT_0019086381 /DNA_START=171 /DNA_END=461 /DNA_ORIENTATION=-
MYPPEKKKSKPARKPQRRVNSDCESNDSITVTGRSAATSTSLGLTQEDSGPLSAWETPSTPPALLPVEQQQQNRLSPAPGSRFTGAIATPSASEPRP